MERNKWSEAAAAYDDGRGLALEEVDLHNHEEMSEVYQILDVAGLGEKTRLKAYIRSLQRQNIQEQEGGIQSLPTPPHEPRGSPPPPSSGRGVPKRPRIDGPPSADDNSSRSPSSALKYVATETLHCSSSMVAMEVVKLLETAWKGQSQKTEEKYVAAANYILKMREAIFGSSLQDEQIKNNERFFTGAFCDALNAVTGDEISVLHQGCIGHGFTHSDFSARNVLNGGGSSTLMVGEGKSNESSEIRRETRGQIFNELIRHRKIDAALGFQVGARPILLLVINYGHIALDLAFPSKKGNAMETKEWLSYPFNLAEETETFFTIPVATVNYSKGSGRKNLPVVLRFIGDTLEYLNNLNADLPRQQFKTPFVTASKEAPKNGEKCGDNVTIIETESGKRVYKEFCYYLRQEDGFNTWDDTADKNDQRKPPSDELLTSLGEPYQNWKVETGPFGIQILHYDFIEGNCWPTSKQTWIQVLEQVKRMHRLDYVHGDLLPRNVIFSEKAGNVIDFDLTRKQGERYVSRYNYTDFTTFRHLDAQAGKVMKKEHDVWSLVKMTEMFFHKDFAGSVPTTVNDLIQALTDP